VSQRRLTPARAFDCGGANRTTGRPVGATAWRSARIPGVERRSTSTFRGLGIIMIGVIRNAAALAASTYYFVQDRHLQSDVDPHMYFIYRFRQMSVGVRNLAKLRSSPNVRCAIKVGEQRCSDFPSDRC
jgi:hypothetical protein